MAKGPEASKGGSGFKPQPTAVKSGTKGGSGQPNPNFKTP